ncbi:hypothetical protein [Aeromonas hydrophila]|uniref:hypothetical protein n=1 Tax=Aeromonas hydrophila TaxID=644 RepID=UPI00080ABCA3|nr:hypothetical protein [Aeromonas hydrophila]ANT70219.1 hypothetical protein TK34_22385 [Aeromonas hydrophila]
MALSILEKVGLQKQAATLKGELKTGTLSILDKLTKQRELAAVMAKLKGDAVRPALAADADEEGTDEESEKEVSRSVQGFAFAGVHHPAWVKNYETRPFDGADTVVSSESLGVAVLLPASTISPTTQEVVRDSLRIAWPAYYAGGKDEHDYLVIGANNAWKGIKSPFPAKMRKKVRRLVEQAVRVVNKAFAEGVDGYTLKRTRQGITISKDGHEGTGKTVAAAFGMLRSQGKGISGVVELLGERDLHGARERLTLELVKLEQDMPGRENLGVPELEATIAQLKQVQAMPELQELNEYFANRVTEAITALEAKLVELAPERAPVITLSMRYLRGDFNSESPTEFRKRILAVSNEGMGLDDMKKGVVNWIETNPGLIAA